MIIKILSIQVPQFWEAIKYTVRAVEEIEPANLQVVYVELLHALLNDKAQCFVSFDKDRILKGLIITRIAVDKVTGVKFIQLESLFAWDKITDEDYKEAYDLILLFAKKNNCKYITGKSSNPRVLEIVTRLGFKEKCKVFEVRL
uniref:Acetyltransferase n=1 Tax=viral metagenome TaxID=1070528 RepID=A0A6H1ZPG0_9ZZZZ